VEEGSLVSWPGREGVEDEGTWEDDVEMEELEKWKSTVGRVATGEIRILLVLHCGSN